MSATILSISSGLPVEIHDAMKEAEDIQIAEEAAEMTVLHRTRLIEMLNHIKVLVAQDRMQGLIIIGRDPVSGLFLNEMMLDEPIVSRTGLFAYLGVMAALSLEIADLAAMAPMLMIDGQIIDPYQEMDDAEDLEESDEEDDF